MIPLLALSIVFLVYGVGDMIATKSKAIISMMLVGFIVFAVMFWTGTPKTIFADSGFQAFSSVTICMFLVHLGTTIRLRDFIAEWKTVVIVAVSTASMAAGVYFICQFFMDKYYALVGGPTLAGGMVAYLIMKTVGDTLGRTDVNVFALLVLSFQGFIGIPIASNLGRKEGSDLLRRWKAGEYDPKVEVASAEGAKASVIEKLRHALTLPEKYNGPNVIIFKVAIVAFVAQQLSTITGIHQLILSLIFGVIFHEVGFLDDAALSKANGFAFVVAGALTNVFAGLADTTPQMLVSMLGRTLLVMLVGVVVAGIVAVILGKILHFTPRMAICMMVTALFGFPRTFLISQEIARACGTTEEEIKLIEDYIMPKLVIGGITSVSVVSGLMASVMCTWI